jgi:hypothetical protein
MPSANTRISYLQNNEKGFSDTTLLKSCSHETKLIAAKNALFSACQQLSQGHRKSLHLVENV